jgi:hypothetical protein
MITITLSQIREHGPCEEGWRNLLKHLGKTKADNEVFPFRTIVESNGLDDAIWALRCLDDQTPARLFAVACAQEVLHLMEDQRSIDAVKMAHLRAYGEVDDAARAAAWAAARDAAWAAARAAARAAAWAAARDAAWAAARAAAWTAARDAAWEVQRDWLLAIVDNY